LGFAAERITTIPKKAAIFEKSIYEDCSFAFMLWKGTVSFIQTTGGFVKKFLRKEVYYLERVKSCNFL